MVRKEAELTLVLERALEILTAPGSTTLSQETMEVERGDAAPQNDDQVVGLPCSTGTKPQTRTKGSSIADLRGGLLL